MKPATLQARKPFGRILWLVYIELLFLFGFAEWVSRLEAFQAYLTPPKMGSSHYQLGHKLALLDDEVKDNGPIDCIMIGSSMVDVGFDPESFQDGYHETTGRDIRCFNFGIDASTAVSSSALAKIIIEDYKPRLLIFGTDARDYAVLSHERDPRTILDTPWVQYRHGNFSLEGWLQDHSYLYRYRQHFGRLVRFQFMGTSWSETHLTFPILANGFTRLSKVSAYINDPPNLQDGSYEVRYYGRIYSKYRMLDENFAALEKIMDHNDSGTHVIVVEMPVSDGLYFFFGNGKADYDRFVRHVDELTSRHDVPFWRTEPLDSIPDTGWADYSHMNAKGAAIFSTWLGTQVGEAETQGRINVFEP